MPVTLTEKAAEKVRELMTDPAQEGATGLRVQVTGGGCSGLSYKLKFEREPAEKDRELESQGVKVFIDPKSLLFVDGIEIDYYETMMGSGFQFKNPNATGSCGCGQSFSA